ncbi:Hsp90 protein-domain-containing protein [Mrakia frigida]|uniref:heat shock protein Hsp90 family protein n=1 Tax=Mrakia frigida TaxID=29902 RepID=UPI003FCC245E
MRLSSTLLLLLSSPFLASSATAQEGQETSTKHEYQSDVSRLRNIVVNSLYGTKSIFLRELLSNSNDALEKLRLTSLIDKDVAIGFGELNVTIRAERDPAEIGGIGRLVIHDTGIGMTPEELKKNLGTIAKSGTSDFLSQSESPSAKADGNLIGQFGLGFYSSFLIASHVRVASLPPPSVSNPHPKQYVFESAADGTSFEIYEDPRGNTLGERGTEVLMVLKEGEKEWLEADKLRELVAKHSSFASTFPIYLETVQTVTRPVSPLEAAEPTSSASDDDDDDDEGEVEEEHEEKEPETEEVEEVAFERLNKAEPLWMRDPKAVEKEEYEEFYKATSKDSVAPLAWSHFKADSGAGISFRALIFVPSELPTDFWGKAEKGIKGIVRLMVKRVFITDDLGDNYIPRWLSFLKIHVDADDLPLTVSRDTITSSRFVNQLQRTLIKKSLDLFTKIATSEPEKYEKLWKLVGNALKIGVTETYTDRARLSKLLRFETNLNKFVSLDEYASRRRAGQTQIFFLAGVGQPTTELAKSPFVEKLHARGYEVLLLDQPMDEVCLSHLRNYESMNFQDVTKKGLKFGDEDIVEADEKAEQERLTEEFSPLISWIKDAFKSVIKDVIISQRLVTSPTAIVSDDQGMSANMLRVSSVSSSSFDSLHFADPCLASFFQLMAAQSDNGKEDPMLTMMRSQARALEINPHSPIIKGLLEEIVSGDSDEETLKETMQTLLDVTLLRSGFELENVNTFFGRVESLLRRSINVSQSAKTKAPPVKPAPEVEAGPLADKPPVVESQEDESVVDLDLEDFPDLPVRSDETGGRMYEDLEFRNTVTSDEFKVGGGGEAGGFSMEQLEELMAASKAGGHDEL